MGEASPDTPIVVQQRGDAVVLAVSGDLDYQTAPAVRETLLAVLADRPTLVVIDLNGVDFVGSAGLALLIEAVQACGSQVALRVVAAQPAALRPLRVTGLDDHLNLCLTVEDALVVSKA